MSSGGVARNVAENLARLGVEVTLITAVGDDPNGRQLLEQVRACGVDVEHARLVPGRRTGVYLAILDDRGLVHAALDEMDVLQVLTPDYFDSQRAVLQSAQAIFLDANVPLPSIAAVIRIARRAGIPIAADPTSVALAPRLAGHLRDLWLVAPNASEAGVLCAQPVAPQDRGRAMEAARQLVSQGVEIALVTLAEFGVVYATAETSGHVPAVQTEVVDPTGAGDAQTAAVLFGLLNGIPLDESIRLGVAAATLTLREPGSVVPGLSLEALYETLR